MKPSDERSLLRWYPPDWRERYGAEMLALIEDTLGGGGPTRRLRAEMLVAGIKERMRRRGLIGRDLPAADRCRAGEALVLAGWAAVVVAGAVFAKSTEHWRARTAFQGRVGADAAYLALEVSAALGAFAVVAGVIASVPALRRAVVAGRWPSIRGPIRLAGGMTLVSAGAVAALATWAHHLTAAQRNGGSGSYTAAFLGCGVLLAAATAAWTGAGIRAERHLRPGIRLLRAGWISATVTGAATIGVTCALIAWWAVIAAHSPWVLHGAPPGPGASWWAPGLGTASILALIGSTAALAGGQRLASAARAGLWQRMDL